MNEYFLIALSLGTAAIAAAGVYVMANWNDWRHPRQTAAAPARRHH
jgi:hypothetical protein